MSSSVSENNNRFRETVSRCKLCKVVCEDDKQWNDHCATKEHNQQVHIDEGIRWRIELERKKIQKRLQQVDREAEELATHSQLSAQSLPPRKNSFSGQQIMSGMMKRKQPHSNQPFGKQPSMLKKKPEPKSRHSQHSKHSFSTAKPGFQSMHSQQPNQTLSTENPMLQSMLLRQPKRTLSTGSYFNSNQSSIHRPSPTLPISHSRHIISTDHPPQTTHRNHPRQTMSTSYSPQRMPTNNQIQQESSSFSFKQAYSVVSESTAFQFCNKSTSQMPVNDNLFSTSGSASGKKLFVLDDYASQSNSLVKIESETDFYENDDPGSNSPESYQEDQYEPELSRESDVCDLHPDCSPDDKEYLDDSLNTSERQNDLVRRIFPRQNFFKMDRNFSINTAF